MTTCNASRFPAITFAAVCLATLLATSAAAGDAAVVRAMKDKHRQVAAYEQLFTKKYGADAWYVFRATVFVPDVSQSMTRVMTHRGVRNLATNRVTRRLETKTFKLDGSPQAADMLWNCVRSSFQYEYRVFHSALEADAYYQSLQP